MATTTDFGRTVTLDEGDDVYEVPRDNELVTTIYGLGGNDRIVGGGARAASYTAGTATTSCAAVRRAGRPQCLSAGSAPTAIRTASRR